MTQPAWCRTDKTAFLGGHTDNSAEVMSAEQHLDRRVNRCPAVETARRSRRSFFKCRAHRAECGRLKTTCGKAEV